MSRTVDRLVRQGLVAREADPRDRRRHILHATEHGRSTFAAVHDLEADVFPAVDDPAALRRALVQILSAPRGPLVPPEISADTRKEVPFNRRKLPR